MSDQTTRRTLLTGAVAAGALVGSTGTAQATESSPPIWKFGEVALLLVDYQPEVFAGLRSADPRVVELNARLLARAARALDIPVVLTTVGVGFGINRPTVPSLAGDLPGVRPIDRNTMDAWDDPAFRRAVRATGRRRPVVGGLYTEICVAYPTVHALADGRDVMVVADASGGTTQVAHEMGMARMIQAGAIPSTAVATVLEWFRDWSTPEAAKVVPVLQWYNTELATLPH